MRKPLWTTPTTEVNYVRDPHLNSFWIEEKEHVDPILKRNQRIRLEGLMRKNQPNSLMEGHIRFAFSIPPNQYGRLKKEEPEIWALLHSKDQEDNMRGGQMLAILHPEWTLTEANR